MSSSTRTIAHPPPESERITGSTRLCPGKPDAEVHAARAAGTFLNHSLNNSLQAVMYRAELLRDHEDPQVAEAGRWLAECVRAMADTVRLVQTLRRFATVAYPGREEMLDPSCLGGDDAWKL